MGKPLAALSCVWLFYCYHCICYSHAGVFCEMNKMFVSQNYLFSPVLCFGSERQHRKHAFYKVRHDNFQIN